MNKKSKKTLIISAISVLVLVALDQLTKYLAVVFLKNKPAISIIKDVFELQYLENQSAAFGMDPVSLLHKIFSFDVFEKNPQLFLDVKMGFFIVATVAILILFVLLYLRIPTEKRFQYIDWILIFFSAGAIGNFIDRVSLNYVVDFLYFKLINFPIFNVADIYVTCSAFALIALGLFYYKDEDFDLIFPPKNKEEKA
jgi:signal peptidase II